MPITNGSFGACVASTSMEPEGVISSVAVGILHDTGTDVEPGGAACTISEGQSTITGGVMSTDETKVKEKIACMF